MDLRYELTRRYLEIGGLLNSIQDDDEREELQAHGERVLNQELHAGSLNRAAVAPLNTLGRLDVSVNDTVDAPSGHSLRVVDDEPTDDQIYNRPGVEGGIGYSLDFDGPDVTEAQFAALAKHETETT